MKLSYNNIISFIWSTNIDKSLRFYCDILGLHKVFESQGWIELAVPGLDTGYIAVNRWAKPEPPPKNEFITLGVEDIEAFKKHLLSNDVECKGDLMQFYEEGVRMLKFYDPDRHIITAAEIQV